MITSGAAATMKLNPTVCRRTVMLYALYGYITVEAWTGIQHLCYTCSAQIVPIKSSRHLIALMGPWAAFRLRSNSIVCRRTVMLQSLYRYTILEAFTCTLHGRLFACALSKRLVVVIGASWSQGFTF